MVVTNKHMLAGLFVPGILVGAAYGRLIGVFVSAYHPSVDESTYALLGSASYMAGSMRIVVSVCVMLLELTNQLSLLPLMMLVLVIAKAVGEGSGVPGIYQRITSMKAFPVLGAKPDKSLRHITAADLVAHEHEPEAFSRVEQVSNIVAKLRACNHNGFPVLDAPVATRGGAAGSGGSAAFSAALMRTRQHSGLRGDAGTASSSACASPRGPSQLLGVMLRHHLLVLLRDGRAFQHTPVVTHNSQRIAFMCASGLKAHAIRSHQFPASTCALFSVCLPGMLCSSHARMFMPMCVLSVLTGVPSRAGTI